MISQLELLEAPKPAAATGPKLYRFLMRCPKKGCATIHRVTVEGREVTKYRRNPFPGQSSSFKVWEPVWPFLELHCRIHRYPLRTQIIKGQYSEKHVCDARCISAIGPNCECSCGGENHGAMWEGGAR